MLLTENKAMTQKIGMACEVLVDEWEAAHSSTELRKVLVTYRSVRKKAVLFED